MNITMNINYIFHNTPEMVSAHILTKLSEDDLLTRVCLVCKEFLALTEKHLLDRWQASYKMNIKEQHHEKAEKVFFKIIFLSPQLENLSNKIDFNNRERCYAGLLVRCVMEENFNAALLVVEAIEHRYLKNPRELIFKEFLNQSSAGLGQIQKECVSSYESHQYDLPMYVGMLLGNLYRVQGQKSGRAFLQALDITKDDVISSGVSLGGSFSREENNLRKVISFFYEFILDLFIQRNSPEKAKQIYRQMHQANFQTSQKMDRKLFSLYVINEDAQGIQEVLSNLHCNLKPGEKVFDENLQINVLKKKKKFDSGEFIFLFEKFKHSKLAKIKAKLFKKL